MARQPRIISESGSYHIIFRGADKRDIFREESDYDKLKNIIIKVKQDSNIKIYAYCFMKNHVHLLLKEQKPGTIPNAMRRILTAYAVWFNKKYGRTGPLTEGRYKSYPVEDDEYTLTLVRYIHRNPVKAFIVDEISEYPYTSYNDYLSSDSSFVDIQFILKLICDDQSIAVKEFKEYHMSGDDEADIIAYNKNHSILRKLQNLTGVKNPKEILLLPEDEMRDMIYRILDELNVTKAKLSELMGVSLYSIRKILTK